jgi:hypothetical protein
MEARQEEPEDDEDLDENLSLDKGIYLTLFVTIPVLTFPVPEQYTSQALGGSIVVQKKDSTMSTKSHITKVLQPKSTNTKVKVPASTTSSFTKTLDTPASRDILTIIASEQTKITSTKIPQSKQINSKINDPILPLSGKTICLQDSIDSTEEVDPTRNATKGLRPRRAARYPQGSYVIAFSNVNYITDVTSLISSFSRIATKTPIKRSKK